MDFSKRHIGPDDSDINKMLSYLGFDSIEQLINATIPDGIQFNDELNIGKSISEYEFLNTIKRIGKKIKSLNHILVLVIMVQLPHQ